MHTRVASPPTQPSLASRRRADLERLEAQLAEWTAIIAQGRASAKRSAAATRSEFDRVADELQVLRNEAGARVMLLKGAIDLDWEAAVSGLDHAWGPLRATFQKAEARF